MGPMAPDPTCRGKPAPGRTATVTPAANGAHGGVRGLPRCAPAPHAGAFIRAHTVMPRPCACVPHFQPLNLTKNGIFFWPGPFGDTSHGVREPNPAPNLQQDGAAARFWGPLPLSHYDRKPMTVSELSVLVSVLVATSLAVVTFAPRLTRDGGQGPHARKPFCARNTPVPRAAGRTGPPGGHMERAGPAGRPLRGPTSPNQKRPLLELLRLQPPLSVKISMAPAQLQGWHAYNSRMVPGHYPLGAPGHY